MTRGPFTQIRRVLRNFWTSSSKNRLQKYARKMHTSPAQSESLEEIELGLRQYGYPALARWMAKDPDSETFIYRKFDQLSARNLLFLQCQLIELEEKLKRLDGDIRRSREPDLIKSQVRWETFVEKSEEEDGPVRRVMEVQVEIQKKLKEYHEALLLQSQIAALDRPRANALSALRKWFCFPSTSGGSTGQQYQTRILGKAQTVFENEHDLAALRTPADKDPFSKFLQDHWGRLGKNNRTSIDGAEYFQEQAVARVVAFVSSAVAAILLIGAITSLYFISSPGARLGTVACFTIFFALSLSLFTNAKRAEIFAATAAYAAVLVVFVSGNLGGSGSAL